jgi:hypothetical protein
MLIKNMMDDLGDSVGSTEVPIPNVSLFAFYSRLAPYSKIAENICIGQ